MYLYFNRAGQLKEIINDEMIKKGNYGINKMYVYFEDNTPRLLNANYLLPDGTTLEFPNYHDTETAQIPFNPKRDLIYFKYYTNYRFIVIDLEEDLDNVSPLDYYGTVWCSLEAVLQDYSIKQLGDFTFNVEQTHGLTNEVATQEYLSLSNYQYFKTLLARMDVDITNINLALDEFGYIELTEETSSGTLTAAQLLQAGKEQCVINWNGNYYYKNTTTDNSYLFVKVDGVNNIYAIEVDLTTGDYEQHLLKQQDLTSASLGVIADQSVNDICQAVWGKNASDLTKPKIALRRASLVYSGNYYPQQFTTITLGIEGDNYTFIEMTIELRNSIIKCHRNTNMDSWSFYRISNDNNDTFNDLPYVDLGTITSKTRDEICQLIWGDTQANVGNKVALRRVNFYNPITQSTLVNQFASISTRNDAPYSLTINIYQYNNIISFGNYTGGSGWVYKNIENPMTTAGDIIYNNTNGRPTRLAIGNNNELLGVNNSGNLAYTKNLPYITTAPSADNTSGGLIIVVLDSEPDTYYDGYYYIITE